MSQSLIHIKVHTHSHRSHIKAIASNLGLMHRIKNYVSGEKRYEDSKDGVTPTRRRRMMMKEESFLVQP